MGSIVRRGMRMPTYEYSCTKCGHTFEIFQSITAPPIETCPICSGTVERLLGTGGGIIFKGTGFYATDYRSEAYKREARKESGGGESKKNNGAAKKNKSKDTKSERKATKSD